MRRKLFCILLTVMTVLFFMDFLGISLRQTGMDALVGKEGCFTGKVVKISTDSDKIKLEILIKSVNGQNKLISGKILVNYYGTIDKPWELYNEVIEFTCEVAEPSGMRNPHCFDYSKYLKSRGIRAVASITKIKVIPEHLTIKESYEKWLFMKRCMFENILEEPEKGIVVGVLFGDTTYMDEDVYEDFRNNGTAHILAVSGLHVGILYSLYKRFAGESGSKFSVVILVAMLFSYGVLSMWSPSVVRATLMIAMSITAKIFDLRYDMLTSMSAVGLILITVNPYVIFGAGFQMSFLAITSIAFIEPVIPDKIPGFLTTVLAVNIGLLPYQIYQFNYISLVSVAANLPIVFLAGYFVPAALISFVVYLICGNITWLEPLLEGMALMISRINQLSTLNGYGAIEVVRPPLWTMLITGGFIFFFSSETFAVMRLRREYKKICMCIAGILILVTACQVFTYSPLTNDDIVFVDVGQGDCMHIRSENKNILIDGGGSISYNVGKNTLKPYLLRNGAGKVDMALVTHEHTDHYKGIAELDEVFTIKAVMSKLTSGKRIQIDENVHIEVLWPERIDKDAGQDENSQCSVFMVHIKGYKVLITGDLDSEGERQLIKKYHGTDILKADILKIGHHGSKNSTCEEFLQEVMPEYAVIQVGKNNYGHPHTEVIEKCQKTDIIVLRNDYNGAVGFSFGKGEIHCHTMIKQKG